MWEFFIQLNGYEKYGYYKTIKEIIDILSEEYIFLGDACLPEIDNDMLEEGFLSEYFPESEPIHQDIHKLIENISEHMVFDLLMDEWDDLYQIILSLLDEYNIKYTMK